MSKLSFEVSASLSDGGYIRRLPLSAKSTTIRPNSGAKIDGDSNAERGIDNG
jgi:hypothetical protein